MGSFQIRGWIHVSCISKRFFATEPPGSPPHALFCMILMILHRFLQATFRLSLEWDKVFPIHRPTHRRPNSTRASITIKTFWLASLPVFSSHKAGFLFLKLTSSFTQPLTLAVAWWYHRGRCSLQAGIQSPSSCAHTLPVISLVLTDSASAPDHPKWCHPRLAIRSPAEPTPATSIHTAFEKPPKLQPSQLPFLQLFNRKWRWMDRQRGSTAEYRELYSTSCDNP